MELAGLPTVPKCEGNPEPSVHCLMGTSYASAFGVGSEPPRTFITHQWPYSMYASPVVPHTDDPVRGAGTMAYGIRTDRYRCKISPFAFCAIRLRASVCCLCAELATLTTCHASRSDIVNMKYNGETYLPEWNDVVSEQLYDCAYRLTSLRLLGRTCRSWQA